MTLNQHDSSTGRNFKATSWDALAWRWGAAFLWMAVYLTRDMSGDNLYWGIAFVWRYLLFFAALGFTIRSIATPLISFSASEGGLSVSSKGFLKNIMTQIPKPLVCNIEARGNRVEATFIPQAGCPSSLIIYNADDDDDARSIAERAKYAIFASTTVSYENSHLSTG